MATSRNNTRRAPVDPSYRDNPVFKSKLEATMAAIVPENYTQLDISFPPYWKADLASGFRAQVLGLEPARNEQDFDRWLWRNVGPAIDCRRGAVKDGEIETLDKGRIFTTGAFGGLRLENYIGFELAVICAGQRELDGNEESKWAPRTFWEFQVYVSPETLEAIESTRDEDVQFRIAAAREAKLLRIAEMERINVGGKYLNAGKPTINTVGVPAQSGVRA
jgi:hypothetical protein